MYKVIDVAKLFSVSKVTIYKKITANKDALKGHITKKKNITYLDDDAVEIIKNSLQINKEKASGRLIDEELNKVYEDIREFKEKNDKLRSEKISMINEEIVDLESAVRLIQNQLNIKEQHLHSKDEILDNFEKLVSINKKRIEDLEGFISSHKDSQ